LAQLQDAKLKGFISRLSAHRIQQDPRDHLAANFDVWACWVCDSEDSYQVAPEYSICKSTQADSADIGTFSDPEKSKTSILFSSLIHVRKGSMLLLES
jgi:hypothetical protein